MQTKTNTLPQNNYAFMLTAYLAVYAVCLILNLCGVQYFAPIINSGLFYNICMYIDNHTILLYIVKWVVFTFSTIIFVQAIFGMKSINWKYMLAIGVYEVIRMLLNYYLPGISIATDIIFTLSITAIHSWKLLFKAFISSILLVGFELLSAATKDITSFDHTLIALLYSIDYYLLIIIYKYFCLEIKNKERRKLWALIGFYF